MKKLRGINVAEGTILAITRAASSLPARIYNDMHPAMSEYKVHSSLSLCSFPSPVLCYASTTPDGIRFFARHDSLDASTANRAS